MQPCSGASQTSLLALLELGCAATMRPSRRGLWPVPPCICRPAAGVSPGPSAQRDAAMDTHMQVFMGTGFLSLG